MAGMFGRSATLREQALANPQPFAPAMAGGLVDQMPGRSQGEAMQFMQGGGEMSPLSQLQMTAPRVKPHFFGDGGTGTKILRTIGEMGIAMSAGQGDPWALHQLRLRERQAEAERENQSWMRRYQLQRSDRLADEERERMQPRYFSGASDQVRFDPATGQAQTIYDAPEPYETYGNALGYERGTPEYRTALQDYVLRSYGPTAGGVRSDLEEQRLDGRLTLEGVRQANRAALRSIPTYRDRNPRPAAPRQPRAPTPTNVFGAILAKQASGQPLTPAEQQTLGLYSRGGRRAGAATGSARTATDPRTGKKVQWDGKAWVPVN